MADTCLVLFFPRISNALQIQGGANIQIDRQIDRQNVYLHFVYQIVHAIINKKKYKGGEHPGSHKTNGLDALQRYKIAYVRRKKIYIHNNKRSDLRQIPHFIII